MYSNNLSSVPDYVNINCLQNRLESFARPDYTVYYHGNGYERIPDGEISNSRDGEIPNSRELKSKKKKKEFSEKCLGNSDIDLIDFSKDKAKKKKDNLENVALTPVQSKESELSVFVPVIEKQCHKSTSCRKSDKCRKETPCQSEEGGHYLYVPIFGKECYKSPSCSKSDKNKKEKREKKHKSCTMAKNHPFLACVKENCTTKYEEWKKMLQKYVNPESADKPPKWFLEFMKQYKQDLIHDVVHKTTRRIFKATEGLGGPLNCCRSKSNDLNLTALMIEQEKKTALESPIGVMDTSPDEKQTDAKVICDGCNNYITGIWYRCCNCAEYDLCETCENSPGIHDVNHVFLKIKRPLTNQGKQFLVRKSPLLKEILYEDSPVSAPSNDGESKFQLCSYDCKFIRDETIPDGTVLQPKEKFFKSWLVRNNGTVPWDSDVKLQFMWGTLPPRRCEVRVPPLKVGEEDLLSIELSAPEKPGHYESHWQLRRHRRRFGPRIWCSVEVESPKPITNRVNVVNAIPKTVTHVQILRTPPTEDVQPSNDQTEKESVYKSVSEFISQTVTPNNTPLEISPPRSPDPNVDLLGIVVESTINDDKSKNVAIQVKLTNSEELPPAEHCPQEFFVDAEETLPENEIGTLLSPKSNDGSPVLTPTDSSMEVLSEDEDDEENENPDIQTALNTSIFSACSDNDYVMVPWPECFVLESSSEGENSKDEDVIICEHSPDETHGDGHWCFAIPKEFARHDSRVSERNNNCVFIAEDLSLANPPNDETSVNNDGEGSHSNETLIPINSSSSKPEGTSVMCPELQLLLTKCVPNKTQNYPASSELSKNNYEACNLEISPGKFIVSAQMRNSDFKTPIASPQTENSPNSGLATSPIATILSSNKSDKSSVVIFPTVSKQEAHSSTRISFIQKSPACLTSDSVLDLTMPVRQETPTTQVDSGTRIKDVVNFSSTSQKEIKEKIIMVTDKSSTVTFQYPSMVKETPIACQQQNSYGNQNLNPDQTHSCESRLENPPTTADAYKSQHSEGTTNEVQWNQVLADQMTPHSASQVATNIMNTALTAGAMALHTAKAVFNTLQAKQPKSEVKQLTPMEQLMEMGFCDRSLNTRLLQANNNDLEQVVAKLIELADNNWHQRRR